MIENLETGSPREGVEGHSLVGDGDGGATMIGRRGRHRIWARG